MHPSLVSIYEKTLEIFQSDPRCVGAWEFGSIGKGTDDENSDVDPLFLIKDEDFDAVDSELKGMFEGFGYELALWWPEAFNNQDCRNYAALLKVAPGKMVQYDITISRASSLSGGSTHFMLTRCGPIEVLFDKQGLIAAQLSNEEPRSYSPEKLLWNIERYWLFLYIHVKYLKRGDDFRLIYAQQELFNAHLDVLHALHPDAPYRGWWPWTVKHVLSAEEREAVRPYFGSATTKEVAAALETELNAFARHARTACEKWNCPYPTSVEADVREYYQTQFPVT